MDIKELHNNHLDLYRQKKLLEEELKLSGGILMDAMEEEGLKTGATDIGQITIVERPVWKYSGAVDEINNSLKKLRKEETENGTATKSITKFLKPTLTK